jgi:hypothetical protein
LIYEKKKGDKVRLDLILQTRRGNFIQRRAAAVELQVR